MAQEVAQAQWRAVEHSMEHSTEHSMERLMGHSVEPAVVRESRKGVARWHISYGTLVMAY